MTNDSLLRLALLGVALMAMWLLYQQRTLSDLREHITDSEHELDKLQESHAYEVDELRAS